MGEINTAFVKLIATVWHRFTPSNEEASTLADMLIPMDLAGEEVSENFEFDDEPSDFNLTEPPPKASTVNFPAVV